MVGEFAPDISYHAEFAGPMDALKGFGQRYFGKVNKQIYELVRGDTKESRQDRGELREAFGLGSIAFAAALAVGSRPLVRLGARHCPQWSPHLSSSSSSTQATSLPAICGKNSSRNSSKDPRSQADACAGRRRWFPPHARLLGL